MPKISVVIPMYNKAPHIVRAIRSVLSQTEADFEVVVIDDGSTDEGAEIVANMFLPDSRLKLLRQENQGVSAARNRGVCEAHSDLIAFLDADDEWEPDHLETLIRLRTRFPQAGAFSTAYSLVNTRGKTVPGKFKAIPAPHWEGLLPNYFESVALGDPPVCSSTVAIPLNTFYELGFFRTNEKIGEDLEMWGRIALHRSIAFSWKGKAVYHLDASERAAEKTPILDDLPFVKTAENYFSSAPMPLYLKLHVNDMRLAHINSLIRSGRKAEALKKLCRINLFVAKPLSLAKTMIFLLLPLPALRTLRFLKRRIWRI